MNIRIGSSNYEIIMDKDLFKNDQLGFIDCQDKEIKICNTVSADETVKQTFWHEVVHGIFREIYEMDLFNDEQLVDNLGKMIHRFLEDNDIDKVYKKICKR